MNGLFVTGTDTGVGKTLVSAALIHALRARGFRVAGMKPVATGARSGARGLRNEDAEILMAATGGEWNYGDVNPYCFLPAIAPHLAAAEEEVGIDAATIHRHATELARRVDWLVVEGIGGWRVPLGPSEDVASLALRLGFPVILVVGLRLGCLNHALLSAEAIAGTGCRFAGWVANTIEPRMERRAENVETLRTHLEVPFLGAIPWIADPDSVTPAGALSLESLLAPPESSNPRDYAGRCHCGNLEVVFTTRKPPSEWPLRLCQCGFCRAHGAIATSDPQGKLAIAAHDPDAVLRYRFGKRTAEFLLCQICGTYVAAIMNSERVVCATLNARILATASALPQAPIPVSYESETAPERRARRFLNWTPVTALPPMP